MNIWILSGTETGRNLTEVLLDAGESVVVTTGTGYRKDLYGERRGLTYIPGKLGKEGMAGLVKEYSIQLMVDATHPYSTEVTENAIDVSRKTGIRYIRFEPESPHIPGTKVFKEYSELSGYLAAREGNILLVTGTEKIGAFSGIETGRLYVRIVPFLNSVEESLNMGIRPGNIIAISFRMSSDFNSLLYRDLDIKFIVTKEPGDTAGVQEIVQAALKSGREVLVIRRPEIEYPEVAREADELINMIGNR